MLKLAFTDIKREKKMLVNSLETMEMTVSKNKDLSWEGWDVVHLKKVAGAMLSPQGVFINGGWYLKTKFALSEMGWEIPDKFMR
jgi:hypothetical protein